MAQSSDLDPNAVRRQFARRVERLALGDFMLREVERRMLERLELVRLEPALVVDVGSGLGQGAARLQQRYPGARVLGVDHAETLCAKAAALHGEPARTSLAQRMRGWFGGDASPSPAPLYAAADAARLPLPPSSVDLIWSNLAWSWFAEPVPVLEEWYRAIRPGGLLMFSAFGVDTLKELRGIGAQLPVFPDMHDIGDALSRVGFAEPVMDVERMTVTWSSAATMLQELSALGGNALRGRAPGLRGRGCRQRWLDALDALRPDEGPIPATFEIVFGHAWAPAHKKRADGYAPVRFDLPVASGKRPNRKPGA